MRTAKSFCSQRIHGLGGDKSKQDSRRFEDERVCDKVSKEKVGTPKSCTGREDSPETRLQLVWKNQQESPSQGGRKGHSGQVESHVRRTEGERTYEV